MLSFYLFTANLLTFRREDLREGIKQNHQETALIAFSSLDDAIDLLNSAFSPRIRALYAFADPKAAKYLAQFIQTDVSFVNHIPASLLGSFFQSFRSAEPIH